MCHFFSIMPATCYLLWFSQQAFEYYCFFCFVDEGTGILEKDGYTRSHNIRMGIQTQVFVALKPLQSCRGYNSIISDRNELGCKQQHAS